MKQFFLPTRVITGIGCFQQMANIVHGYGQRALLICGQQALRSSGLLDRALHDLQTAGVQVVLYDAVLGEPTLDDVQAALNLAHSKQVEVVIGIGGGSAMDTAKATAVLYPQMGTLSEYHHGREIEQPGLPCVTIPTTAGSGAEVTPNAVLTDPERGVKESLRGPHVSATAAIVDPELTLSMPPAVTASSGSDALCQAIEAFVAINAQPLTDAMSGQAIQWIGRSLVCAYEQGNDLQVRSDMLYGSLLAGIAMSNARLGGAHGLAHPLGYRYHIPHGVVCGLLLPYVMEYSQETAPNKYVEVARLLQVDTRGLDARKAAQAATASIRGIVKKVGIPEHLAVFGVRSEDFAEIISQALSSSNLKNNPRPLGEIDLRVILQRAL